MLLSSSRTWLSVALLLPFIATATEPENAADSDIENTVELDTVQVEAQQEPLSEISTQKLLQVPGAGNDPLRAIESLPGVVFSNGGDRAPAIRGSSPEDNGYLIDFMPVGYIFHSDGSSILNDNLVEDFRLNNSAFPGQFSNATGSVIEAQSRAPSYEERQLIVDVSLLKAGFLVEQPISEDQGFYFSARQSLFQYYIEAFLDDEDFEFTQVPEFYDYQGKYQWQISPTESLSVNLIGARDKAGLLFADDSDAVLQDPGLAGGINFEQYFNSQGLIWQKLYDNGLSQTTALSQLEEKFAFNIGVDNRINVKVNNYFLRNQFSYPLNYQHELKFGVNYKQANIHYLGRFAGPPCDEFDPDCRLVDGDEIISGEGRPVINTTAVNIGDKMLLTPDWELTLEAVFSQDDYTEQQFSEPRLNSRWQFIDDWTFTTAYGQHHILPDNFGDYTREFGNRELEQPTADHYELGLEWQVDDTLFAQLEAYYKTLDDLIIARPGNDELQQPLTEQQYANLPRYSNQADGKAWGLELLVNKTLSERWYGWASLAYSRTERTNQLTGEDFRYSYDQPVIINAVANYQYNQHWQLGFKWRYQSGQLITPIEGAVADPDQAGLYNPVYGDINSERLPAYHKLDVRASRSYVFSDWDMDLYVEILNLYGRRNVVDYEYLNADYSEREESTDLPTLFTFGIKARI